MYKDPIDVQCPFCGSTVTTDKNFAIKNGRVMCTTCVKSFDVSIKQDPREMDWYKKHILNIDDAEKEQADEPEPIQEPENFKHNYEWMPF